MLIVTISELEGDIVYSGRAEITLQIQHLS